MFRAFEYALQTMIAVIAAIAVYRDPEHGSWWVVLIGALVAMLATMKTQLSERKRAAEMEQRALQVPEILAYGYVRNYLDPIIRQMLVRVEAEHPGAELRFVVQIPDSLEALDDDHMQTQILKAQQEGRVRVHTESVRLDSKRELDIRTVIRVDAEGEHVFLFDFPTTLKTARLAIRYETDKGYGERAAGFEDRRGLEYIAAFREALEERLKRSRHRDIAQFVSLSEGEFKLPF